MKKKTLKTNKKHRANEIPISYLSFVLNALHDKSRQMASLIRQSVGIFGERAMTFTLLMSSHSQTKETDFIVIVIVVFQIMHRNFIEH